MWVPLNLRSMVIYPNDLTRELLIDSLVDSGKKGLKSVYSVKFLPQDKYPGEPYVSEE